MIIHDNKEESIASLAQFLFLLTSILVFNLSWLPSLLAATDCSNVAVTTIPQAECEALVALYNNTDGPNWTDSPSNNWNITNTPCNWTGITCSGGHVTQIRRNERNLTGLIPD